MAAILERLQRQGSIVLDAAKWVLTVPPEQIDPGVPETLQEMLEVQLEQLSASEQRLLRSASVPGWRFSAWAVAAMTDVGEAAVEQTCEDLAARQQFIRHAGIHELADGSVSGQYEFKHSLYRELLYRRLPPIHRRQFHLRLAEKTESLRAPLDLALTAEMAAHFEAGRDFARAIRYLIANAALAAKRYAHGDSIQMLRHAMELLAQLPKEDGRALEIEILERISDVFYARGEMALSAEMDYKVVELAGAGFKSAQINAWTRLARALAFQDPERCVAVCEKAVEAARTHDDPLLQARAEMLLACWQIVTNGWNPEYAKTCKEALLRVNELSVELPAYYEILYAHVQCVEGDYEGACRTAAAGIPESLENDNLVVFLSAHSSLAHALFHLGQWGELLRVELAALSTAEKNGNAPWAGIFQASLAWLRLQAGDFVGAQDLTEDLLRKNTEEPASQVRTIAMVISGFIWLARGTAGEALQYFRRVCDREVHPRFFLDWYWRIVGRLGLSQTWLAAGEAAKAEKDADLALQLAASTADPALQALAWETKARIAQYQQHWPEAGQWLNNAYQALGAREVPYATWRVHATAAELHRSRGNAALAEQSYGRSAAIVRQLADSFPEGEALRQSLLDAAADRGILAGVMHSEHGGPG
jgi:tetratricopeptide (TPR) repeat protein